MIQAALLTALTIGLWATGVLPEYLTALLFFALAMVFGVAPAATVFAGFASTAFWLVLSGFVLGIAIRKTGLADRVARALTARLSGSDRPATVRVPPPDRRPAKSRSTADRSAIRHRLVPAALDRPSPVSGSIPTNRHDRLDRTRNPAEGESTPRTVATNRAGPPGQYAIRSMDAA